ncbi:MAG TPA: hypothetical protein DCL42_00165 [Deltaproteobacteria bacterium]|nr:MAG: hypothetical protein A2022_02785 [Deltaproteobacteria bacterium GWF2_42_12]OGQ68586.1 MAG: hypothetical protein A3F88_03315 [Deltaproteobacteria bacterium RIFCSPLOWO2_12_FULL_42_16]HAG49737.1 hypothetical protein [Deltaproteobacteria bacterium]
MKKTFLIAFVVFLMPALSSALDFELSLKEQIDSLNVEASLSSKGENVAGALAIEFGTKEDIIQKQKIDSGLSWGDLSVALYISNRTGKDINIIVKDYKKGHGWGRIAKAYGIRTDDLLSMMGKAHNAAKHGKGHKKGKHKEQKEHGKGKNK